MTTEQMLIVAALCCFAVMVAYNGYVLVTLLRTTRRRRHHRAGRLTVAELRMGGFNDDEIKAMGRIPGVPARGDLIKKFGPDKMLQLFHDEQELLEHLESNRMNRL